VGLDPEDWTALQAGPFGYKIDGEDAVVWGYDPNDRRPPPRIRSEPPTEKDVATAGVWWPVTRIGHGRTSPPN
jgi:hypothetical protein